MAVSTHIAIAKQELDKIAGSNPRLATKEGDYSINGTRFFFNPVTDLLKYVYFSSAAKSLPTTEQKAPGSRDYALILSHRDEPIGLMYPDILKRNVCDFYHYKFMDEIDSVDESTE